MEHLKKLMESKKVSQADLARVLGKDRSAMTFILQGKRKLQLGEAQQLADYMGVSIAEILGEQDGLRKVPVLSGISNQPIDKEILLAKNTIQYPTGRNTVFAIKIIEEDINLIAPIGNMALVDYSKTDPTQVAGKPVVAQGTAFGSIIRIFKPNPDRLEAYSNRPLEPIFLQGEWKIVGQIFAFFHNLEE